MHVVAMEKKKNIRLLCYKPDYRVFLHFFFFMGTFFNYSVFSFSVTVFQDSSLLFLFSVQLPVRG